MSDTTKNKPYEIEFNREDYIEYPRVFEVEGLPDVIAELDEFNHDIEDVAYELAYTRYELAKLERDYAAVTAELEELKATDIDRLQQAWEDGRKSMHDELEQSRAECERLRKSVADTYAILWHVNNEPLAPVPLFTSDRAAYEARKILRDLMTSEDRGVAINNVREYFAALAQQEKGDGNND